MELQVFVWPTYSLKDFLKSLSVKLTLMIALQKQVKSALTGPLSEVSFWVRQRETNQRRSQVTDHIPQGREQSLRLQNTVRLSQLLSANLTKQPETN